MMELLSRWFICCQDCGGKLRLPAATDEDLDRLCCQMTLTIPGRA